VTDHFARDGVDEAVTVDGTAARVCVRQYGEALVAEFDAAMSTEHLVAFRSLFCLPIEIFLGRCHLALGALPSPGFLHPL